MAVSAIAAASPAKRRKPAKGGQGKIAKQLENMKNRAAKADIKAKAGAATTMGIVGAGAAATAAGMARGYFGADRMQLLGFDAALVAGLGVSGYAAYCAFKGDKKARWMVPVGTGLLGAGMANIGEDLGANLAEGGGLFGAPLFGASDNAQLPPRAAHAMPNGYGRGAGIRRVQPR